MTDIHRIPKAPIHVDSHVHLFPERLFRAIRGWFERVGWEIPSPYETEVSRSRTGPVEADARSSTSGRSRPTVSGSSSARISRT